jgi:hypothetical protein
MIRTSSMLSKKLSCTWLSPLSSIYRSINFMVVSQTTLLFLCTRSQLSKACACENGENLDAHQQKQEMQACDRSSKDHLQRRLCLCQKYQSPCTFQEVWGSESGWRLFPVSGPHQRSDYTRRENMSNKKVP